MKLPLVVVLLALSIVGTGLAVSNLGASAAPRGGTLEDRVSQLAAQLDELRAELNAIQGERQGARSSLASATQRIPALSDEALDAAVARWMAAHPPEAARLSASQRDARDLGSLSLQELIELVTDESISSDQMHELWSRLSKAGRSEEIIAELERLAENSPHDPDAQLALGTAYLYRIFDVGQGPLAGEYATKADAAFARAIELDDTHYEARMMKAVSLSNWPAFLGKTPQAISEFETLIDMQSSLAEEERTPDPYLMLGNLYSQTGERERAIEIWRNGLALFPDHAGLRRQLELHQ
ncbi:MAG: hypothetical protein WD226_09205 [Planctomycetota bacterium]